jgi:hypothetical protein
MNGKKYLLMSRNVKANMYVITCKCLLLIQTTLLTQQLKLKKRGLVYIQNTALIFTKYTASLTCIMLFESSYYNAMNYENLEKIKISKYNKPALERTYDKRSPSNTNICDSN